MTLSQELADFVEEAGTVDKLLLTLITGGSTIESLAALKTVNQNSLIAALNEIVDRLTEAAQSGGASINDTTASAGSVYSSNKVLELLTTWRDDILGGAGPAIDTLKELGDLVDENAGGVTDLLTALGTRVRFDAPQTLTEAEQAQARANIAAVSAADVGSTAPGLVDIYRAARQ